MDMGMQTGADGARIVLTGSLGFTDHAAFRDMIAALGDGRGPVVIDLAGVDHIDSAGLGLLLVARDRAAGLGRTLSLANARGQVARLLDLAQAADLFAIERTGLTEA